MMNERIRELDQQAIDYAMSVCDADGVYQGKEYLTVVKEKFAELIVGECASVCENSNYEFGTIFTKMIKEHFGVEE